MSPAKYACYCYCYGVVADCDGVCSPQVATETANSADSRFVQERTTRDMHHAEQASTPRIVWFHRWHDGLTGGQLKHSDYFDHVRRTAGFAAKITFANAPANAAVARQRRELWRAHEGELVADWTPGPGDVLFLAGTDWRYAQAGGFDAGDSPRINLIQGVQHAHKGTELHGYLARRAIRVCVSAEVAAAIEETGLVRGPLVTIPNGIDVGALPVERDTPTASRRAPVLVVGYKRPGLANDLALKLQQQGIAHTTSTGLLERKTFLRLLAQSAVVVCLPQAEEGFYLPALEAMACGCVTITLDCVGNRSFCAHLRNCLVASDNAPSLLGMIRAALDMSAAQRDLMLSRAADTVAQHTLDSEREKFQSLLANIDEVWREARSMPVTTTSRAGCRRAEGNEPLLDFAIVGAQKCGTTALRSFLGTHPEIAMCAEEMHLFDSPDYSADWTREQINERYRRALADTASRKVCGESTPAYMFLPEIAPELKRYNPRLKLIVLLRDPVQRAISAYYMEKGRGVENKPLWLALLLEPLRCLLDSDVRSLTSARRQHAYRRRGLYSKQLRNLFRHFHPNQVLVVRNADLRHNHHAVLRRVFRFLGVSEDVRVPPASVFANEGAQRKHRVVRMLLRAAYAFEALRLASLLHTPALRAEDRR